MPSVLEELQLVGRKESMLPKTLTVNELDDLVNAIDGYFYFNYDEMSFFDKRQQSEIKLFLDLRSEVLSKYNDVTKN
jgi:predicted P-loop ATPase